MSGQPYKNPLDILKYRDAYLGTLKLQTQINQANLEANKIFKKTGMTPSEKTDTRTIEEKYADLEGLKISIRKALTGFADNRVAEEISQNLETLGADDLIFASNNMANILEILKKYYKNGIANANQFMETYERFKTKFNDTKGVNEIGNVMLMRNVQAILDTMIGRPELDAVAGLIADSAVSNRKLSRDLLRDITTLINTLPTGQDIEAINAKTDPILRAGILSDLQMALSELPSKAELQTELGRLNVAIRSGDADYQNEIIGKIREILLQTPEALASMEAIKQNLEERYKQRAIPFEYIPPPFTELLGSKKKLKDYAKELNKLWSNEEDNVNPFNTPQTSLTHWERTGSKAELIDFLTRIDPDVRAKFGIDLPLINPPPLGGIKGKGIAPRKTQVSYRIRPEQVDFTKGIDQMPKYIKFGRYLIHKPKLEDNIIKITSNSGAGITGLKPERVSRHFGGVIKKIVNGLNPTYEEIAGLTDDEKDYLYKLAKKSQILDRLTIPAPNKSKDDKLSDRFDILKGEIQAGNNSVELIKEFKTLLLALSNKDLIPKSQAKDILMDLVAMGY
jgi:hypothetical protein